MKRAPCYSAAMLSSACLLLSAPCAFAQAFVPVTQSILANPDPADWLMINRTFDEQRFSPLDQINKTNVGQLRMAWSRGLPNGTQELTPIVYRGVMYLYAPGASIQAVDATNGDLIWEYTRNYPRDLSPTAARNKSLGIFEDMIYFAAPDGFLVALDARDRQAALGNQGRQWRPDRGRPARRRRQGDLEPHLRAEQARKLLHRGARRQDRPGGLEILRHRGTGRAGRRHLGQHAGGAARGRPMGPAGLLRSQTQGAVLGHRQPEPLYAADAARQRRRGVADRAGQPLQQLDGRARRRRPASSSGTTRSFPATTGTPITITSAFSCTPASVPIPNTSNGSARRWCRTRSATSWSRSPRAAACSRSSRRPASSCGRGRSPTTTPTST